MVQGWLYLGAELDPKSLRENGNKFLLNPDDLVTHGVIIGMTGSGKTGAAIVLIEEVLLRGIPVVVIDPKGDAANIAIRLSSCSPEKLAEWVTKHAAAKEGLSVEEYARRLSERWRYELAQWGLSEEHMRKLAENTEVTVYTPGSTAGEPVSILGDINMPSGMSWEEHEEVLLEKIRGVASALLYLAGRRGDPVSSNEHAFLMSLLEYSWRRGEKLTLEKLLSYVLNPPFSRIGVLDVDDFLPLKDRKSLVVELNRIIASPHFKNWITGSPLDFDRILGSKSGKAKLAVFYVAHLNEAERMFAVTLILEALYAWMFKLGGSPRLRALLFFDEVYGFIPPHPRNPPSKRPLMLLLKQARAFGLGIMLSTQNPVDIDYKVLTNAGVWMIGRLQTERDKMRVMEGLKLAAAEAGSALGEREISEVISSLKTRVFLVHNVHGGGHRVLKTRCALTFLRGPLTLSDIRRLVGQKQAPRGAKAHAGLPEVFTPMPIDLEDDIPQFYLPIRYRGEGLCAYFPLIVAKVNVTIERKRPRLYLCETRRLLLIPESGVNPARPVPSAYGLDASEIPEDFLTSRWDRALLHYDLPRRLKARGARRRLEAYIKRLVASEYRYEVYEIADIGEVSRPGESFEEFVSRVSPLINAVLEERRASIEAKYETRIARLRDKIAAVQEKIAILRSELAGYRGALGILGSRRVNKQRLAAKAARLRALEAELEKLYTQMGLLLSRRDRELRAALNPRSLRVRKYSVVAKPSNVEVASLYVLWVPLLLDRTTLIPRLNMFNGVALYAPLSNCGIWEA